MRPMRSAERGYNPVKRCRGNFCPCCSEPIPDGAETCEALECQADVTEVRRQLATDGQLMTADDAPDWTTVETDCPL